MQCPNIQAKQIEYGSSDYENALNIRHQVLRVPIGRSLYDDDLSDEQAHYHFAAYSEDQMRGAVALRKEADGSFFIKQLAVLSDTQKLGIGSALMTLIENFVQADKPVKIHFHARCSAAGFYEKHGYQTQGEVFSEVGLPHIEMMKIISPSFPEA